MTTSKGRPNAGSKATAKNVGKRFTKGQSGNPAGMRKGTKHRRTILIAQMQTEDRATVTEKIIKQAKRGCRASQRMIQDRLEPLRKATVKFKLRRIANAGDVVEALADVADAFAAGSLTTDEVATACLTIEKIRDAIRGKDLTERFAALEERVKQNGDE